MMATRWTLVAVMGLALSCGGTNQNHPNEGGAGSGGAGGAGGGAGSGGGGETTAAPCPGPTPTALTLTQSGRVDLPVKVAINGTPAVVGQPGIGRTGREYRLSLLKFFLSEPALMTTDGRLVPAQLVDAAGLPLPYGVHLVDADDEATQLMRLAAEVGSYSALRFGIGVPAACNYMTNTNQVYPLNADSEMYWTWGSEFMFIRAEGNSRASATGEWGPFEYHVGFNQAFASLTVPAALSVGAAAPGPTLTLDLDLMLEPTPTPDSLPAKHTAPNGWVVDNIENNGAFTVQ